MDPNRSRGGTLLPLCPDCVIVSRRCIQRAEAAVADRRKASDALRLIQMLCLLLFGCGIEIETVRALALSCWD